MMVRGIESEHSDVGTLTMIFAPPALMAIAFICLLVF
jgi:hypothetical protein